MTKAFPVLVVYEVHVTSANLAAKLAGVTTLAVSVPVNVSASVANSAIPFSVAEAESGVKVKVSVEALVVITSPSASTIVKAVPEVATMSDCPDTEIVLKLSALITL